VKSVTFDFLIFSFKRFMLAGFYCSCLLNLAYYFLASYVLEIVQSLLDEMEGRFPQHDVLDAFGNTYPYYWMQEIAEESF
jgi:hypothetical protein